MSSQFDGLGTFSDSSDDIGVLADFAKREGSRNVEQEKENNSAEKDDNSDPDWVRDYTPRKENGMDEKEAFLASIEDDDDSVIDLISQDPEQNLSNAKEDTGETLNNAEQEQQPAGSAAKKARAPSKPKSKLPLVVAPKLDESLVLLQSVDTDLDLSGDVGAVGRVKLQDGSMFLDIKGVVYRTSVYPCNTVCVVNVGDDEARITAVLDEAVTLECERNLFASDEIVVHGDLDVDMAESSQVEGSASDEPRQNGKKVKDSASKPAKSKSSAKTKKTPVGKSISKQGARKR